MRTSAVPCMPAICAIHFSHTPSEFSGLATASHRALAAAIAVSFSAAAFHSRICFPSVFFPISGIASTARTTSAISEYRSNTVS